jgi:hypothetical protein
VSKHKRASRQQRKKHDDGAFLFAGQEGIPSLYRYQKFQLENHQPNRPSDPEILADILKYQRIHCSNPLAFNDPWDCKPCLNLDALQDPHARKKTALSLIATRKKGPQSELTDQALLNVLPFLRDKISAFTDYLVLFIPERWAIYCLSRDPCSTLMWSHYSGNHTGICLQFAVPETKLRAAVKVK